MQLSRITKHRHPKHQLYQPGFNDSNGCWLDGEWITVPAEEFEVRKKAHEKLYKGVGQEKASQSHHGKRVAVKNMTEAQRTAWEHFSGDRTLEVRYPNGTVGGVGARMAGKNVAESTLKWLRDKGAKVIPKVLHPNKKIEDQSKLVPKDLLSDDTNPVDVWKIIVKQNRSNFREFAKATAKASQEGGVGPGIGMPDFMAGVAVQNLLELEEQILRHEISKKPDLFETPEETLAEYVAHRAEMKEELGASFDETYKAAKRSHNECARTNLDNSKGFLACYVLPEFRDDGSHDAIDPRDFPWGRKD